MKRTELILIISMVFLLVVISLHFSKKRGAVSNESYETIRAENCRAKISVEPADSFVLNAGAPMLHLTVALTNLGGQTWGFNGVPMKLGAVWFDGGKRNFSHNPNKGEQWFDIPAPLKPTETIKFAIDVNLMDGRNKIWLSPLQPGAMWCFDVGDKPKEIKISTSTSKVK